MKSTSGIFSALIIFDGTIVAIQQQDNNKPVVPLDYKGIIPSAMLPVGCFCSVDLSSPNFSTVLKG